MGCIYLGMYTGLPLPHGGQPTPHPAYLVQTLANVTDAGPYLPKGPWIGVSAVDAIGGTLRDQGASNLTAYGVMGSTCGVTP